MKRNRGHLALLILVLTSGAQAQIELKVSTDRYRYIVYEPIHVMIEVKNYAGHTLRFGGGNDGSMTFTLTDEHGRAVKATSKLNPVSGLKLPVGTEKSVTVTINDFFSLQKNGNYELTVRLGHRRLPHDFVAAPVRFEVQSGSVIWQQFVGVPTSEHQSVIRDRRCCISTFRGDRGDIYVLRIEDDHAVYATIRLGPRVQGVVPRCDVDARCHLHVLLQVVPRLFRYRVLDLDGKTLQQDMYMIHDTVPRLIRDPDIGRVMVVGGKRAVSGVDYNVPDAMIMSAKNGAAPPVAVPEKPKKRGLARFFGFLRPRRGKEASQ